MHCTGNNPQMILTADRNIYAPVPPMTNVPTSYGTTGYGWSGMSINGTCVTLGTNFTSAATTPCWTEKMHQRRGNARHRGHGRE